MILMPLDHVRDYLSNSIYSPTDLEHTTPGLFFTRLAANFCAPVFIFLAGTSMFLWKNQGKTAKEVSYFLFTRGLFLILMELTLIRTVWTFNFDWSFQLCQIFWAIGCSMVALSAFIYLPYWAIVLVGTFLIFSDNYIESLDPSVWGNFSGLFKILFGPGEAQVDLFNHHLILQIEDPIATWIGVITIGYAFGKIYTFECPKRIKSLFLLGCLFLSIFFVLRYFNLYGNPQPWELQKSLLFNIMSIINLEKYPVSLDFILLYLGLSFFILIFLEKVHGKISDFFISFGRVPFGYYVSHLFLIHSIAVFLSFVTYGKADWFFSNHCLIGGITPEFPIGFGYGLPTIYFLWVLVVFLLYPFCRWYGHIKSKYKSIKFLRYI